MATQPETANKTDRHDTTNDTLAEELGVDADLLDQFVGAHPDPTAPIVLGWATRHGRLSSGPEALRDDVEAWLADRDDDDDDEPVLARLKRKLDPETDATATRDELREARILSGVAQTEVAARSGVSPAAVSDYEAGREPLRDRAEDALRDVYREIARGGRE